MCGEWIIFLKNTPKLYINENINIFRGVSRNICNCGVIFQYWSISRYFAIQFFHFQVTDDMLRKHIAKIPTFETFRDIAVREIYVALVMTNA